MKQAAIFDMDGLLVDTEKVYQMEWDRLAGEMGVTLAPEFRSSICGTSGERMYRTIERFYHVEDGEPISVRVKAAVLAHLKEHVDLMTGAKEILEMFKRHGVRMAVASSSPEDLISNNLEKTGLTGYFDALVSGVHVEHGKPDPDIFLLAAKQLGMEPKDCYVFEDSISGIQAGCAAGMAPIMIPDMIAPTEEMREVCSGIFDTLLDAAEAIEHGVL